VFTRVKETRDNEYLQIVENYRDGDRVRQRMVLYVGRYASIDSALKGMAGDLKRIKRADGDQREADELASKLKALKRLVKEHPDMVERDRLRAERYRWRGAVGGFAKPGSSTP
jgi:hypothetical protein